MTTRETMLISFHVTWFVLVAALLISGIAAIVWAFIWGLNDLLLPGFVCVVATLGRLI